MSEQVTIAKGPKCEACGMIDGKERIKVRTTNGALVLCRQCLDDINRKNPELPALKAALQDAITNTTRAQCRCVEMDGAGNSYVWDWTSTVRIWAALCDLDLEDLNPVFYKS